jgi:RecA-family ATPase
VNPETTNGSDPAAAREYLRSLSDAEFYDFWPRLTIEARSAAGVEFIDRFRRISPYKPPKFNGADYPAATSAPDGWPEPLDLEALAEREPKPPRFNVTDLLPCGYATLLAGHGGVGKSGIALYLAVCIAAGVPFFGIAVARRRVMYLSCEDREGILHWRLARICAHLGVDMARQRGWLEIFDLVGQDTVLWDRDPRTGYTATPALGILAERVKRHETEVLMVDGISDTFGGNENAKTDVKRYVNALLALVPADVGSLLLIGHVNRPTAANPNTTEGYSGTTGWHNAVRSRLYLYPETRQGEDGDRAERTGDLILELQKNNFGPIEQSMRFAWNEAAHLFLGREIVGRSAADRAERDRIERDGILAALRACQEPVPAATTGQRTAYHVLSARAEFPDSLRSGAAGRRTFWRQIEALRAMSLIREESIRRGDGHYRDCLAAVSL